MELTLTNWRAHTWHNYTKVWIILTAWGFQLRNVTTLGVVMKPIGNSEMYFELCVIWYTNTVQSSLPVTNIFPSSFMLIAVIGLECGFVAWINVMHSSLELCSFFISSKETTTTRTTPSLNPATSTLPVLSTYGSRNS